MSDPDQALASNSALDEIDVDGGNDDQTGTLQYPPLQDQPLQEEKSDLLSDDGDPQEYVYNPEDDPMYVEFNEDQWLPCIPGLSLTIATIVCAIVGAGIGLAITLTTTLNDDWMAILEFPGKMWVNALKLLVLPLIVLMMVVLPSRVDEIGVIGRRAVPLYLFTSTCAAIEGTCWAWIVQPGNIANDTADDTADVELEDLADDDTFLNFMQMMKVHLAEDSAEDLADDETSPVGAFLNIFYNAVPPNIIEAMGAKLTILGVIVFFIAIGILLRRPSVKKEEKMAVLNFCRAILRCIMQAIVWIVWFTPIGMMSLICVKLAATEHIVDLMSALGFYVLCVLIGHSVHLFLVYPAIFFATTRGNGWKWFLKIYKAPLLAFATSSSAATLPRSLQVAQQAGVRPDIYEFILPLGAAINMDGTALGFPIMIGLIAQMNDVAIGVDKIFVILILSIIISVGTAPIPNAGMVYLTMLFTAAGLDDYIEDGIATLFILDWFVDRIETAVNVTSDQYVAKILDDVTTNANKKHLKIVMGCCLASGDPNDDGYQAPQIQMQNSTDVTV